MSNEEPRPGYKRVEGLKFHTIEKAPGWDWIVFYLDGEEPQTQAMSVFGQMTPEAALVEARFSLGMPDGETDYEILAIVRADSKIP